MGWWRGVRWQWISWGRSGYCNLCRYARNPRLNIGADSRKQDRDHCVVNVVEERERRSPELRIVVVVRLALLAAGCGCCCCCWGWPSVSLALLLSPASPKKLQNLIECLQVVPEETKVIETVQVVTDAPAIHTEEKDMFRIHQLLFIICLVHSII